MQGDEDDDGMATRITWLHGGHFRGSGRTPNVIPWSIHGAPENSRGHPVIPGSSRGHPEVITKKKWSWA